MISLLPVEEATELSKELGISERFAVANAFRGLLHNPQAAAALFKMLNTLQNKADLDARTRELVILRTAWITRSEYEFCTHVRVSSVEHRLAQEEILGVRDPDSCGAYSDKDRAVLRMADELHDRAAVSSET